MIKVISFDIWATLLAGNKSFRPLRSQRIVDFLGLTCDVDVLACEVSQANRDIEYQVEQTHHPLGLIPRMRLALSRAVPDRQFDDQVLRELYLEITCLQLSSTANMPFLTEDDLPQTLQQLVGSGLKLALISNTGLTEGQELGGFLAAHGVYNLFTYPVYSDEVDAVKPDTAIFDRLIEMADVKPHEILHVGDNMLTDLEGGLTAGLHAALYDPKGKHPDNPHRYSSHRELAQLVNLVAT